MDINESNRGWKKRFAARERMGLFEGENLIVVYTGISILLKMKEELGLESMVEYMNYYSRAIGRKYPGLHSSVSRTLNEMNVERIYREAMNARKN